MSHHYYVSKAENKPAFGIGMDMPAPLKVVRKYPEFDPDLAISMLERGKSITYVRKHFVKGSECIKRILEDHGIDYQTNGQKSYANALQFDEVPAFREYLESLGYKTTDSKKNHVAFNVYLSYWACATIIKKPDGNKCLQMNSGIIGLYKKWKGI